jgi:hypothetical protein
MQIHLLTTEVGQSRLFQEVSDMDYHVVKVPAIGGFVTLNDESPDKAYVIVSVKIMYDESGFAGKAVLMPIDDEGSVIDTESPKEYPISHITPTE